MHEEEKQIKKRILELADKSYRNSQYLFTSFLTPAEYSEAVETLTKEHYHNYDSYGGTEMAERVILRFGSGGVRLHGRVSSVLHYHRTKSCKICRPPDTPGFSVKCIKPWY